MFIFIIHPYKLLIFSLLRNDFEHAIALRCVFQMLNQFFVPDTHIRHPGFDFPVLLLCSNPELAPVVDALPQLCSTHRKPADVFYYCILFLDFLRSAHVAILIFFYARDKITVFGITDFIQHLFFSTLSVPYIGSHI
jgi:hypothetical protein